MDISHSLAEYAYKLRYEDLSPNAIRETKRRLIDSLGCGLNTFYNDSVKTIRDTVYHTDGPGSSTLLGSAYKAPPDHAAFSNGYAIRYLDWNDTYLSKEPAHPSDNIAGALAVADMLHKSGKDLILSIVIGYEIQCRLCDASSLRARGWDHVNYLLAGNALAASKLLESSVEQSAQAVNIALNNLSTRQNRVGELSNWKAAAASNAVRNSVFSAIIAKKGFTGPSETFEGKYGFQKEVSGKFSINTGDFGGKRTPFMIEKTYIKKHDGEIHSQTAIDAALKLRGKIDSIDDIDSMTIETQEAGFSIIGDRKREPEKWDPQTKETADHSIAYITTVALMDGDVTEDQFVRKRFRDNKTLRFLKKVKVKENKEFTMAYPYKGIPNKVILKLKDGRTLSEEEYFQRGHPNNPMSDREVEEKFRHLAGKNLGAEKTETVLKFLWGIDKESDISQLFDIVKIL
ncbi:MmgE/PrpD family protein [Candidatus Parvarchaeota archaeon]|nr:MmgE/PrpD family protein [Candidatus Parvarchaeota archaeon]